MGKNARIPALGYGAVQKKDESQEATSQDFGENAHDCFLN